MNESCQSFHELWVERVDVIGASATDAELLELWACAPSPNSEEAKHLWRHLTHQPTRKHRHMNPQIENQFQTEKREREAQHHNALQRVKRWIATHNDGGEDVDGTKEIQDKLARLEVAGFTATENGIAALERLIHLAETRSSGQIRYVAEFLAAVWGVTNLDMDTLKGLDEDIGADMIAVLNSIRWHRVGVYAMAVDARKRIPAVLKAWGL